MKWMLFSPEIFYLLAALCFLLLSMTGRLHPRRDHHIALALAVAGVAVCVASLQLEGSLFSETYKIDLFSQVFKLLLSVGLALVVGICSELRGIQERYEHEVYLLLFLCTLATMLLVSSVHWLGVYVSLELSSYSLYILVALRKDWTQGIEAGLKYFLVGVFASAMMLFGMVILYGTTGTLHVGQLVKILPGLMSHAAVVVGLLLALSGFFFKLAVFPFHFWAADVYQGAAHQIAAYIATVSKVAAIAVLVRMVAMLGGSSDYFVHVLAVLSVVSMTVGNLAAIAQKDLKRLLAYSTVAHAGYVLIGILSMNPGGYAGAIFYAMAILVMKFTVFLVLVKVAWDGTNLEVDGLAGLHRRSPLLAMALMVALFSLAGLPPTVGFTGKFLIFTAAMERGYFALVLIAMINVVISLYYYLLMLRAAYLLEPEEQSSLLSLSPSVRILAGGLVVVMVAAGIFPRYLMDLARSAAQGLM